MAICTDFFAAHAISIKKKNERTVNSKMKKKIFLLH